MLTYPIIKLIINEIILKYPLKNNLKIDSQAYKTWLKPVKFNYKKVTQY